MLWFEFVSGQLPDEDRAMSIRAGTLIRTGLVVFPVGLIVIGICSVLWSTRENPRVFESEQPLFGARGIRSEAITPERLRQHISALSEQIGVRHAGAPKNLNAARFYIASTLGLNNIGYRADEQVYEVDERKFANVEAELPGARWPEQIIIVGAHYDSVATSPGADDNASGVAAMLVLADAFAGNPQGRTIRFVGFTNEEPPWFQTNDMGSMRYAERCQMRGETITAMIAIESVGYFSDKPNSQRYPPDIAGQYPTTGNFVAIVANLESAPLGEFVHASFQDMPAEFGAFPAITPGIGWSDHWSFWRNGYPAIMITDTAPYRNPNYHQAGDTLDTLDLNRLAKTAEAMEAAIRRLANAPDLPWIEAKN